jgi:phosphoglucosamine mutase
MKLFGTDGLRAVAGEFPLDSATVELLGRVLFSFLKEKNLETEIIIGQDTRESSDQLFTALTKGFCEAGGRIDRAGVISTPALAFLAKKEGKCAIAITASHNPFRDNGIKIFGPDGYKMSEESESWIEPYLLGEKTFASSKNGPGCGENREMQQHFFNEYCTYLKTELFGDLDLSGIRVVIDCANGAVFQLAPDVLRSLGAEVTAINDQPDGRNINQNCGALYPNVLFEKIREDGYDCGFTFDGDGDRCMAADSEGVYDGDFILAVSARYLQDQGKLNGNSVVATPMSNMGLEVFLRKRDIRLLRVPVGDKNVLDMLKRERLSLGGEQSGHIIFMNDTFIGDGLITALQLLRIYKRAKTPFGRLCDGFTKFPQILLNIPVKQKPDLNAIPEIADGIKDAEQKLSGTGRILVRYSGTEMLARIMIEGPDQTLIESMARQLGEILQSKLN